MCTKVVSSHDVQLKGILGFVFCFFVLFLQSSFAELRPLDFGNNPSVERSCI